MYTEGKIQFGASDNNYFSISNQQTYNMRDACERYKDQAVLIVFKSQEEIEAYLNLSMEERFFEDPEKYNTLSEKTETLYIDKVIKDAGFKGNITLMTRDFG